MVSVGFAGESIELETYRTNTRKRSFSVGTGYDSPEEPTGPLALERLIVQRADDPAEVLKRRLC